MGPLNKNSVTTLLSLSVVAVGMNSPMYSKEITNMGLYATSGALTNWLAIHMLFEKIPFLYGSGVIPLHFNEFKAGIKTMMMEQFFTRENIAKFVVGGNAKVDGNPFDGLVEIVDYDRFFVKMTETVMESQLGGMLTMFGGAQALDALREPFAIKMQEGLLEILSEETIKSKLIASFSGGEDSAYMLTQVEAVVESRLDELTPIMVKEIIQRMIKEHLGWLVVWGGVFGALIGVIASAL
ncbi:MAG: DUF445 domain-containing protein [Bacteriovoracaceae bacterium]|nr:DUF445 domain-containing protein [Opitutae bacterium]MBT7611324.1 DUF445 domain-containing protein [Bacteriovoracaceae bacterium]